MKYNYLETITTIPNKEEEVIEEEVIAEEGVIAINDEIPGKPILVVYKDGGWCSTNSPDSIFRMSRLDDLYNTLYEREWLIGGRLFVSEEDELYMTTKKYESALPVISEDDLMFKISTGNTINNEDEDKKGFETQYTKLMRIKSMNTKEIDFGTDDYYKYLISARNLIDKSTTVDLFSYSENSTDYGSVLNLNPYFTNPGDYSIKLGVMYVKSGVRITESFLFKPFTMNENDYEYNNFLVPVNKDVTIEVKNGCIRVFPDKEEVTECIIHYCHLIYEKLL